MPMTEEMKKLVLEADDVALVFGTESQPLLIFIHDTTPEENADATELITRNGLDFRGLFAMADGKPVTKCASVEAIPVMGKACVTYVQCIAAKRVMAASEKTSEKKNDDGASWLSKLYQLPDTREKFGPA